MTEFLKYTLVSGDNSSVTLFYGGELYTANDQHPNWEAIKARLLENDASVIDLFEIKRAVARRFTRLTDRVTVDADGVKFDGDQIDDSLSKKIVEYIDNDDDSWKGLVAFLEKVMNNPSENSRNQLFTFLSAHDYEILPDGNILGYKGVVSLEAGRYRSTSTGTASVNDEVQTGYIVQEVGDVVTMPRSEVDDNSGNGCSTGLHVADYSYATTYGDTVLAVSVDPRDAVSVPAHEVQKHRVCRYTVLGTSHEKGKYFDRDGEEVALSAGSLSFTRTNKPVEWVAVDWGSSYPTDTEEDDDKELCHDCYRDLDECVCGDECFNCGEFVEDCLCKPLQ